VRLFGPGRQGCCAFPLLLARWQSRKRKEQAQRAKNTESVPRAKARPLGAMEHAWERGWVGRDGGLTIP